MEHRSNGELRTGKWGISGPKPQRLGNCKMGATMICFRNRSVNASAITGSGQTDGDEYHCKEINGCQLDWRRIFGGIGKRSVIDFANNRQFSLSI
jgi:hypothetical protein